MGGLVAVAVRRSSSEAGRSATGAGVLSTAGGSAGAGTFRAQPSTAAATNATVKTKNRTIIFRNAMEDVPYKFLHAASTCSTTACICSSFAKGDSTYDFSAQIGSPPAEVR